MRVFVLFFAMTCSGCAHYHFTEKTIIDINPRRPASLFTNSCYKLFSSNYANSELSDRAKSLILNHSIMKLREKIKDRLNIMISEYADTGKKTIDSVNRTQVGELIQSMFIFKVLSEVFPKAEFSRLTESDLSEKETSDSRTSLRFIPIDFAEHGPPPSDIKKFSVPMLLLKKANQFFAVPSKKEAREIFKFSSNAKIVSVYSRATGGYIRRRGNTSNENPDIIDISEVLIKGHDIIILSTNPSIALRDRSYVRGALDNQTLFQDIVFMRDLIGGRAKIVIGRKTLILNDTVGRLPFIHAASDLVIVKGPLNFMEALQAQSPLIIFNNKETLGGYGDSTYTKLEETAQVTGLGIRIYSLEELNSAQQSTWFNPNLPKLKDEQAKSLIEFLDYLEFLIKEQLQ